MAVARSSSVMLVLLCIAAAVVPSFAAAPGDGGRFSETPLGRKLLNINMCGKGSPPNYDCTKILRDANKPVCCTDNRGNQACFDVGSIWLDKCGSCNTRCDFGSVCCKGVCANLMKDKNNCGRCGNICRDQLPCFMGMCRYGF